MNNIDRLRKAHTSAGEFSAAYGAYLGELMAKLDPKAVDAFVAQLERARVEGKRVFIAGNGGSAATASHMGLDWGGAVFRQGARHRPFHVQALTDHVAAITASGNDFGYEHVFTRQLMMYYQPGDILIVVSASGNSPNILHAARYVKERGGTVLGLLGFDGGAVRELCDIAVVAETPQGEYGPVEDVHSILNHVVTLWLHLNFADE
jgi:D-sedoheptulose 7-phosphate isomerase